jgi:hypothetical protein
MTMITEEYDLVRDRFPGDRRENSDWQRRTLDKLTSQIWHGDDDDHGAMTRFGMGWGPLEVVRARRSVKMDKGPHVYRTIEIFGGGVLRLAVTFSPTGRSFKIVDERERAGHVDTGQVDPQDAVLALRDSLCTLAKGTVSPAVWDALETLEKSLM